MQADEQVNLNLLKKIYLIFIKGLIFSTCVNTISI